MLNWFSNLFKKRKTEDAQAGEAQFRVFLYVTDEGWQAAFVDLLQERGTEIIQDQAEALKVLANLPKDHDAEQALEQMFRLAGEGLRKHKKGQIAEIRLVIDDPKVHYSDMLPGQLVSAHSAALHDYGRNVLRCRTVSFGLGKFGPTDRGHAETSGGVVAFIDAGRLGNFLSRLDRLAPKMSITPLIDLLVRQAHTGHRSGAAAALHIGAFSTTVVLSNSTIGAVTQRVLPFGLGVLARLFAEGEGISLEDSLRTLGDQDLISELRPTEAVDPVAILTSSPAERILGGPVRVFLEEIRASITFFEEQRCAGRPKVLEVFGNVHRVRGLERFLREHLSLREDPSAGPEPLTVEFKEQPVLDLLQSFPPDEPLNLLSARSGDLKIGAVTYTYDKGQLRRADEVRQVRAARETPRAGERPGPGRPERRGGGRSGRRGAPVAAEPSVLDQLRALLGAKPKAGAADGDEDATTARADQQGFAVLAVIVLGLCYQIYSLGHTARNDAANEITAVQSAMVSNEQNHAALINSGSFHPVESIDKVLWTEKILSLSKHITTEMWLTDVYLAEAKTDEKSPVSTKKLVIKGSLLPSTDGHIQRVADFIDSLQGDTDNFMSDFKTITFQGLGIDTTDAERVVNFTIEAVYDATRRQPGQTSQTGAATGSPVDAAALARQAVEKHNQLNNSALTGPHP